MYQINWQAWIAGLKSLKVVILITKVYLLKEKALVEKGCSWIRIDISVCKVGIPILDTLMGKRWYFVPFTLNILPIEETSSADHVSSPSSTHPFNKLWSRKRRAYDK